MSSNCNTAPLAVYTPSGANPWDAKKANHLFRRVAYGLAPSKLPALLAQNPEDVVDQLIDDALSAPLAPVPSWAFDYINDNISSSGKLTEWTALFLRQLSSNGLRDRLGFFWSNHLVVDRTGFTQCGSYMYDYTSILQRNAIGNFRTMVHEIGICPAMLRYLNGYQNTKNSPNENYARELYELFTLGEGNGYTQTDIVETARALTGYGNRPSRCAPFPFVPSRFDDGDKTIFGRTGNWGYDDVIDILFEEKTDLIAVYMVQKLYTYFVHPELPEDAIINTLATTFRNANFEIAPVLRQLFKSEHFFNADAQDTLIKSPVDLFVSFYEDAEMPFPQDDTYLRRIANWSTNANQEIFSPPNVAGWQRDKEWISSPTLAARWTHMDRIIRDLFNENEEQFRSLARNLAGSSTDVVEVSKRIVDHFLPQKLYQQEDYDIALVVFKSDAVPENYYEDGTWNLDFGTVPKQVCLLLQHLAKQPEFQLK